MERIEQEQAAVWQKVPDVDKEMVSKSGSFGGRNIYGPLLVLLKADKLAVLVSYVRRRTSAVVESVLKLCVIWPVDLLSGTST